VRILPVFSCGLLIELGWLAVWPLSGALSHSDRFTTALLEMHPLVRQIFTRTLPLGRAFVPGLSEAPMTDPLGAPAYLAPVSALVLVMLWLSAMYALALVLFDRGAGDSRYAVWLIVGGALTFQTTLFLLPGLFSQDVFSYIAYGRVAAVYDLNPYIWPPSVLRDAVVPWVADIWRSYATPYGPVWVGAQWLIARATSNLSIADQALVYRLVANLLLLTNLGLCWRLLGRLTPLSLTQRTAALAALAWNPLVLFEIAGNAHNDALMITLSLAALLSFRESTRGVLASALFTLGTLVKYLSGLGFLWLTLASIARVPDWWRRARRLLAVGLVAVGVTVVASAPWLELPDSLDPLLSETAGVGYVNALPDAFVLMAVARGALPLDLGRALERILVLTCFAVYLAWEARRVWCDPNRGGVARALARSSLVYILLVSTSVQTWYLCLPICIAVTLGCRRPLTQVALAYGALALPTLYLSYYLREATPSWVYVVYGLGPLALVGLPALRGIVFARGPRAVTVNDDERRLLVRSDVSVGVDHLTLAPRSSAHAQPARPLARDESGSPQ
jgi:hypothetical protein